MIKQHHRFRRVIFTFKLLLMKYLKILYVQVIIGIVLGVIAGFLFPSFAPAAKVISETFVNMIRMVIAPIIFFTIIAGVAGAGDMRKAGRIGGKALLYFEVVTTLALVVGMIVANVIKPGAGVSTAHLQTDKVATYSEKAKDMNWGEFFAHIVPSNVVDAFAKGDILQILFFSVLFAIGIQWLGPSGKSLLTTFEKINKALFNVLKIVIRVSPVGAFAGMAYTISSFGLASILTLLKLLLTFYITGLAFIFIILNLIARYYGFSLWKLLGYIKDEILIVFGASSSEAVLPSLMAKLEAAGLQEEVVGLVVPTGYSFNLDGTTIYLSMCVIFLAQVYNVNLSIGQQLTIIGILLITSKGAAGVTGAGFIVLASTLAALKVVPMEGLALLIGVDRFMSEGRALINVMGNTVATVVIAKSENAIDMAVYKQVVEGKRA